MPRTEVRAGVVIEFASGIAAYASTSFRKISSEDTGAPPAPMKHHGGISLSGFLGTSILASSPSPRSSLDGAVFNPSWISSSLNLMILPVSVQYVPTSR